MPFLLSLEPSTDAAQALAAGELLLDEVSEQAGPAAHLYVTALTGNAAVLGRWQRAEDALHLEALAAAGVPVLRRRSGGPTVYAGDGIVYAALALRHPSVFMDCPAERILNRNVRGFLGALSESGVHTHYFGREWLSLDRAPVALVAWARSKAGAVLIEVFVAHTRAFSLPAEWSAAPVRQDPPFLGKTPITLAEGIQPGPAAEEVLAWFAPGFAARYPATPATATPLPPAVRESAKRVANERASAPPDATADLTWSAPREVPIGFVAAGLALGPESVITSVALAGDFFQDDAAPHALASALVGHAATPEALRDAVNQTFTHGTHVIEGLKSLDALLEALLDARAQALAD